MNYLVFSDSHSPFQNMALEEHLTRILKDGDFYFYLWQNADTIVIGLNQNAWRECDVETFLNDGGNLARRSTGGGTVYHDLGNLNFSFVGSDTYNLEKQLKLLLHALSNLGITAEFSGRNDLTVNGFKFSGNAFRHTKTFDLHHGTLLVDADMTKLGKYLRVPKLKLESKGIKSVRSRVCNLKEYNPSITVDSLKEALTRAFREDYGDYELISVPVTDYVDLIEKYSSYEFRIGKNPDFSVVFDNRYSFGMLSVNLDVSGNRIRSEVYSDMLDTDFPPRVAEVLRNVEFSKEDIIDALQSLNDSRATEIADYIASEFDKLDGEDKPI